METYVVSEDLILMSAREVATALTCLPYRLLACTSDHHLHVHLLLVRICLLLLSFLPSQHVDCKFEFTKPHMAYIDESEDVTLDEFNKYFESLCPAISSRCQESPFESCAVTFLFVLLTTPTRA